MATVDATGEHRQEWMRAPIPWGASVVAALVLASMIAGYLALLRVMVLG